MNLIVNKILICAIFIFINGIVGKYFYLVTGENINAKTVEKYGTAQSRLNELKKDGKGIVSGFVKVNYINLVNRVSELPAEIDVLNVAFQGYPEECSDTPCADPKDTTTCKTILCGDVNALFDYKTVLGKKEWLEDIEQLRKKNKNVIILFELSDEVLYFKDYPEAFDHVDDVVKFLDEYDFDGVNIRLFAEKLHKKVDKLDSIIKFYNDYAVKIKDKIGDKLLSFSFNAVGAFSNVGNNPHANLLSNENSAYNPKQINEISKEEGVQKVATSNLAGLALPIVNTLKEKISIIFVVDEFYLIEKGQEDLLFHVLYAYLEFAHNFNITIQLGLHLNDLTVAVTLEDTDVIDELVEELNTENKERPAGNGFVFTGVGVAACFFPANEHIPKIKQKLQ